MKYNSKRPFQIIFITFIILFVLSLYLSMINGYARDAGLNQEPLYPLTPIVLNAIILIITGITYFLFLRREDETKIRRTRSTIVILSIIIIILTVSIIKSISINQEYLQKREEESGFKEVSITKIKKALKQEEDLIIYFYRENCKYCNKIERDLEQYYIKNYVTVYAYETRKDYNLEERDELLDKLHVENVPLVVKIENGQVDQHYYLDELLEMIDYNVSD